MKRSEIIKKCFDEFYWSNYYETSWSESMINDVLMFFEKQGMLPPFNVPKNLSKDLLKEVNERPEQFYEWDKE